MKHHIAVKFVAIFLAALTLLAAIGSAVGVIGLASMNLYEESVEELYEENMAALRRNFAVNLIHRYASLVLGHVPESYLEEYREQSWMYNTFEYGLFCYVIRDEKGEEVESNLFEDMADALRYDIQVTDLNYRRIVPSSTDAGTAVTQPEEMPQDDAGADATEPGYVPTETWPFAESQEATSYDQTHADAALPAQGSAVAEVSEEPPVFRERYYDFEQGDFVEISYRYVVLPPYTVELYLFPGAAPEEPLWDVLRLVWQYRYDLFWVLGLCLILFAVLSVYLCCAAGKKPGSTEIRPGGMNRIPLDLYLAGGGLTGLGAFFLGIEVARYLLHNAPNILVPVMIFGGYLICLLIVAFFYACVAQFKAPGGFWWHHSVVGFLLTRVGRGIRWVFRGCRSVIRMLPLIWQWLLTAVGMVFAVAVAFLLLVVADSPLARMFFLLVFFATVLACIGVVCYGAWCMGTLIRGARFMAQGNLYHQINTKYMLGSFRDFAEQLNSLAGAAQIAAERQLRSERMKTELITNVSHDIKTPLTSIINYVDLLKMPHSEEENQQYLEVLDRQSLRLKKLVDDLMEMSKASTGNMNVEIDWVDAGESVNQALGEFADKLEKAELYPVFRAPETPVYMLADGRLVWRVMSNLLSNAVKYALPGTRLYVDLMELEGRVIISLKNISREQLNVCADELLERFVRGDASRNTEGSGLGLNIARSLMELQKGQLQLLVDGDLFKVTLVFPGRQ